MREERGEGKVHDTFRKDRGRKEKRSGIFVSMRNEMDFILHLLQMILRALTVSHELRTESSSGGRFVGRKVNLVRRRRNERRMKVPSETHLTSHIPFANFLPFHLQTLTTYYFRNPISDFYIQSQLVSGANSSIAAFLSYSDRE